ncbi:hypothetical protein OQ968_21865 [Mycobacterium sp. 663a-19]|uniref:hypothetical protein n=1 Tax=Mycobacterium sp. 663a-19 TaxID=2986148 RepID=UPI002D1E9484|nr:hypothetical protein [Mycobacterium sp. 663a-19]MEB3983900.1 hypothetical protein [Mycobacterium sp. 663a-19]
MPELTRRARRRASKGRGRPDNRLAILDHALFAQHRAIGRQVVVQVVWIYGHAIDLDGLRAFNHNLRYGLLGRRIERSRVPFARFRWVSDCGPADIEIAGSARPRAELSDWADEQAQQPTDPERGPGWHIGVLPLTDGSTAISLVVSHYLVDGFGLTLAIADAVLRPYTNDLGYPPPRSRTQLRAMIQDARETAQDVPEAARALVAAAKLARRQRRENAEKPASRPVAPSGSDGDGDEVVVVPVITVHIDVDAWDACAKALGGTSETLLAGLAAKLGERLGRRRDSDGAVTLQLPMSDRTEDDSRAIAVTYASLSVDPTEVTTDLRELRAAIKQALTTMRETPDDDERQLLWLAPFTPKRAMKRLADNALDDPDRPVFCSNLRDLGALVYVLARNDDDYATITANLHPLHLIRVIGQNVTRGWLERAGGQLTLQSWRIGDTVGITVEAYQPGTENTKAALRELVARTLAEFKLTGEID